MAKRQIAIGDIHGCYSELKELVESLPSGSDVQLVFLGDYVDRGNNSSQVIEYLIQLKKTRDVIFLKGNHEDLFQQFLFSPESTGAGLFVLNGGGSTLLSYSDADSADFYKIPQTHIEFLQNLQLFYTTEKYFFVHAGVPEIPLEEINAETHSATLLWVREPFLSSHYPWSKRVIHGHTPVWDPEIRANRINIDTGLVYDGMLTALELPDMKFYHVERKAKAEPTRFLQTPGSSRPFRFRGHLPVILDRNGQRDTYETLNFNQNGMLLRELKVPPSRRLKLGDFIKGEIGDVKAGFIDFEGEIVRVESRHDQNLFGVKILQLTPRL